MLLIPALLAATLASAADPLSIGQKMEQPVPLRELTGKARPISLAGKTTVVLFLSTLCPISNDYNDRMSSLYNEYAARGIEFFFVNANNNESPAEVAAHAKAAEFPFPVFKDPGNALADRLGATLTPEAYLFDAGGVLRYHGQIDDSRNPARVRVHGLRDALDQVLASKPVSRQETKAFGCTIKRVRKAS